MHALFVSLVLVGVLDQVESFVSTWQTVVANETVAVPIVANDTWGISWGDGSPLELNASTHVFDTPGSYNVTISGASFFWRTQAGVDPSLKLIDILDWTGLMMDANSANLFSGYSNLRLSANPSTQPLFLPNTTLVGMFAGTKVNAPLNWNLTNVVSLQSMFLNARLFNQALNFTNTEGITSTASMFQGAIAFNQAVTFKTSSVTSMGSMFRGAVKYNQPVSFDTSKVTLMPHMFHNVRAFNQSVSLATARVTDMSYMFADNLFFNAPVELNTSSVLDMQYMFAGSTSFSQPLDFDTRQVRDMTAMLQESAYNSPVNFNTSQVRQMEYMFAMTPAFNHPVNFDTRLVASMRYMFANATSFNQSVTFDVSNVKNLTQMFAFAASLNQPVTLLNAGKNVTIMDSMFEGAVSFNRAISFQADVLTSANNMFKGASKFNKPVVLLNSTQLTSTAGMFLDAASFNQSVSITSTARVTDMSSMFWGAVGYEQNLGSWDTGAVTKCTPFCFRCGLPLFPNCNPCSPRLTSFAKNMSVCNCPINEPKTSDKTCGTVCDPTQVVTNLQVECVSATLPPTPAVNTGPTPSIFLSPLYNITESNSSNGSFVFTLPINTNLATTERGTISQSCFGEEIKCEWQDPNTLEFRQSGCAVSRSMVDMGSGLVGTECTCSHLTVFAIVLRSDMKLAPLCHAQEIDYVLIALYVALALVLVMQVVRLVRYRLSRISTLQHSLLLVVCILRIVYLVAKPVIASLAGLVLLGLLPSAVALSLFIHLLLTWASLQARTITATPFDKFQFPFVIIVLLVFVVTVLMAVLVVALGPSTQQDVVTDGSYVLAALYAVVCVLVLFSGLGLRRKLTPDAGRFDWREAFRNRVLIATLALSGSLLTAACLWVAAVQTDIIASSAATLATTACFYVCDWLSLCVMTWLFSKAIRRQADVHHRTKDSQLSSKS